MPEGRWRSRIAAPWLALALAGAPPPGAAAGPEPLTAPPGPPASAPGATAIGPPRLDLRLPDASRDALTPPVASPAQPLPEPAPVESPPPAPTPPAAAPGSMSASPPAAAPVAPSLIETCWTPEQLAGTPAELVIQRRLPPDRNPPAAEAIAAAVAAVAPLPEGLRGSIRGVEPYDPQARLIALTFDLCEQAGERAGYDGRIVDWLRANGVKATFFAGGKWLRTHPERAMQLLADPLFEVGNHGWTHANLRQVRGEAARDQVLWTQAQYHLLRDELLARPCAATAGLAEWARIPSWPAQFRFPYGACDADGLALTADLGLPAVQWNLVSGDPDPKRSAAPRRWPAACAPGSRASVV